MENEIKKEVENIDNSTEKLLLSDVSGSQICPNCEKNMIIMNGMVIVQKYVGGDSQLIATNGSGIAEGRDLKDKSFNLAQMPNRSTKD